MKKTLLIILFWACFYTAGAQNLKNEPGTEARVIIHTKIELKSLRGVSPVLWENNIYTSDSSGAVTCFDSTGHIVWRNNLPAEIISEPLVTDGAVTVATVNGEIISLIAHTGEQLQSLGIDDSISTNLTPIQYDGDKELFLPKESESRTAIVFGTSSGAIYCLDLETLQEYWRNNDLRGKITQSPLIVKNKILYTGSDGYLYSIDARNGLLNWRWKETESTDFSEAKLICDGKKVFVISNDSQIYCIDLLLGKLLWKNDKFIILPEIGQSEDGKNLFVKTGDKRFFLMSASNGVVLRQLKRPDDFDSLHVPPLEYNGNIYFTDKNSIYSLDNKLNEGLVFSSDDGWINIFRQVSETKFLATTVSGTILIFGIR
ncbi:MAG: hypothetical protein CVV24_14990 [Ignavibacteriae bacterium HGW-Ignavibacteriae-3]|nr:MAG: hypothetical protein CVV24_14990 [Ignavibacteriae bacterium HGW-Ignavibacteriae-3]